MRWKVSGYRILSNGQKKEFSEVYDRFSDAQGVHQWKTEQARKAQARGLVRTYNFNLEAVE